MSLYFFCELSIIIILGRLNYRNKNYFNLFYIYGKSDKVILRTCAAFATRYSQKPKPSPNERETNAKWVKWVEVLDIFPCGLPCLQL